MKNQNRKEVRKIKRQNPKKEEKVIIATFGSLGDSNISSKRELIDKARELRNDLRKK